MTNLVQRLYHRLPAPARSLAATLQGLRLRWWRYGAVSERLIEEARERERWSAAQWHAWRQERLAFVLHRAATRVPYYRDQWMARRRRGDRASWELLEHWPILEKDAVRQHPRAFVADDCSVRRMFHLRTSGTTGTPLDVWRSRATVTALYSLGMARTRGWHGLTLRDRRAMLGGQLVTPVRQRRPPFWVWNAALHQLYMSSYHLAPDLIPHYLDALVRYRIVYLTGYTSSMYALAQEALRLGRRDLKMVVAITSAEPLLGHQREAIAAAFQCPVRETYGMGESVAEATECEAGRLHQWPEAGLIEVLDAGQLAPSGTFGELICTGLLNPDMPFIRYRVGDSGRLAADGARCECGRTLPLITAIDGRTTDLLLTRDGRRVFWLNPVFYGLPVRESQIVQEALDRIRVRYAPAPSFTQVAGRTVVERLRSRMGNVQVILEEVEAVPRTVNGKMRSVICNVPASERDAVLQGKQPSPDTA
jgi:phenylacetate-CoA ligase